VTQEPREVRGHNETVSVIPMSVNNADRSPFKPRAETQPKLQNGFKEPVRDDLAVIHSTQPLIKNRKSSRSLGQGKSSQVKTALGLPFIKG
jgi:hypothetical protein